MECCTSRCRGRGRVRRRGEAGGGCSLGFLSFFCFCRRRSSAKHPNPAAEPVEDFQGCSAPLFAVGDAVVDDVATLGSTGDCSLSADTLSVGSSTLGSIGSCSLKVGGVFCGNSYVLLKVTVSLDGISNSGAGPSVEGRLLSFISSSNIVLEDLFTCKVIRFS